MRVICIDDGCPKNPDFIGSVPVFGEIYNVGGDSPYYKCHFWLTEFGDGKYYAKKRFAPLSSIDETEMIKEREMVVL